MDPLKPNVIEAVESRKIRDFITLKPFEGIYTLEGLSPETIVQSYIFTDESTRNLQDILVELGKEPGSERKSMIIAGDRGVGKTHSLAIIRELIRDPGLSRLITRHSLRVCLQPLAKKKFFIIEIKCQPHQEENLKELFYRAFEKTYQEQSGGNLPPMDHWLELEDSDEQLKFICDFIPKDHQMVILLDDISEKLLTYRNITKVIGDLEFLLTIALATSLYPVFMVATFFEYLLEPPPYTSKYQDLHQKLLEYKLTNAFLIKPITKANILELVTTNIILKTDLQTKGLEIVHRYLTERVPHFRHDKQLFLTIFPMHPLVFHVSFYLHRYIKNFSLLPFIYNTANKILGYRCSALVTIDLIFDLLYHEFKRTPELQIALQSYETIGKEIGSSLPVSERLLARLILKALFIFSITEEYRPTVANIIDALLLSEYQGKPITDADVLRILDYFEEQTPQCIRKLQREREQGLEYQLVTIDHTSLDFIIQAALKDEANLEDKVNRLVFHGFFQLVDGLNIGKDNYGQPCSTDPLEITWRGTRRKGVACWADRYETIHVPAMTLNTQSPLATYSEGAELDGSADLFGESPLAPPGPKTPAGPPLPKSYDWQLMILSPFSEKFPLPAIKELSQRYPTLLTFQPGLLSTEERQKFETAAVLASEENRYRFFDLEEEYQNRRKQIEEDIKAILLRKYFSEGLMYSNRLSTSPSENGTEPDNLAQLLRDILVGIFDEYFPLHPRFEDTSAAANRRAIAEMFLNKVLVKKDHLEVAEKILQPLQLVRKKESSFLFEPESDSFLESPFISDIIYLIGTYPKTVFPLAYFYNAFSHSPFGLPPPLIDVVLIALVAAGKIKIFQSNKADLEVINRMSLSGEFDLGFFDSVQAIEEKVLPLPELLQWGYFLCNTQMEMTGGITQSRKHLKNLLHEWLEFERSNSLDDLFQQIPNDLVTTHLWREMQSCHRNAKAIENIVDNICSQQYNLEEGLAILARTFSNNLKAFQAVLKEINNIREFLEWNTLFMEARTYTLTSEKTDDQAIENLRLELGNFFERPNKLIDPERRVVFQEKFQAFKQAYIRLYAERHDRQLSELTADGKLGRLMASGWWKNLPMLSRIVHINQFHIKTLFRLLNNLQERECHFPVEQILERVPRCWCGFRLSGLGNVEYLIQRIAQTAEVTQTEYKEFLGSYRKLLIREIQKVPSLDDNIARQVVNAINGNFDEPLGLDAVKLINFILKRKIKVVPLQAVGGEAQGRAITRTEFLQNLANVFKELEESRETYFMIDGNEP